ncbi:MAG: nucleotide exchange factor GrpE [Gammaproteobacteria bacterium]|nr:MAG: nucleotide exchange factor GrpE [Gammaproteobacteria bacterium]RLA11427.1 MAG: nucleotide exchange factor GrpE [Gammaproteobacteria bacterium]
MNEQSNGTESDTELEAVESDLNKLAQNDQENSSDSEASELTLEEQLQAALDEADQLREASLRAVAEQENLRRRTQRDVQNAHKFGSEKLLRELVAVVDSLEAALAGDESSAEGVQMTLDLLLKTFEKNSVVALSPQGELFNPDLHQAITMVPSDEIAPNHVLEVIQKGYQLHDRLLRPAMVIVAKAPSDGVA